MKKFFSITITQDIVHLCIILMLYTKFQFPTMPGTRQKVCGGMVVWWVVWWVCKPILVFSFGLAEQYHIFH